MNVKIGIVGLPNVGKSTLFNALLKKTVAFAANYPFATIEPNVGVVEVPDERLPVLAKIVNTKKIVPAAVEFYDIAGLVKGASVGEGLGNKFLSHIREVAAIAHVVRLFEDPEIIHVSNKVDPVSDIQTVETELILADMATLQKQTEPKGKVEKDDEFRWQLITKLKQKMNTGLPARSIELNDEELEAIKQLQLLTMKPVIYVFNVSEEQLGNIEETKNKIAEVLKSALTSPSRLHRDPPSKGESTRLISPSFQAPPSKGELDSPLEGSIPTKSEGGVFNNYIYLNAKLENDVLALSENDQKEYLKQYNLEETGLNRLIKTAYSTLGLISFLTAGELEARAWTITKGTLAPQAAGVIHTDFEKKFIKADVIPFAQFVDTGGPALPKSSNSEDVGGWVKAREQGKVQIVGRDYEMKDGDVVEFKIGA